MARLRCIERNKGCGGDVKEVRCYKNGRETSFTNLCTNHIKQYIALGFDVFVGVEIKTWGECGLRKVEVEPGGALVITDITPIY